MITDYAYGETFMRLMIQSLFLFIAFTLSMLVAKADEVVQMISHRAIYDLTLENASDKSSISGLNGRLAYEFRGSKCEGYTSQFRFVTRINLEDMPPRLTDQQTSSFESADGKEFRFVSKTLIDQDVTNETDGSAKLTKNGITVVLKKPTAVEHKLKVADFPNVQTEQIIRNAKAGKHFYRSLFFDGSDDADKLTPTSVVIGDKQQPKDDAETKLMGKIGKESFWPVTISYFDDQENQDGLPIYRTSFYLYENGVTRDLVMDYGDFSVRGKMSKFTLFNDSQKATNCQR